MMPIFGELEVISTDVPASTDGNIMPITPSTSSVLVTAADISPFPKMSTTDRPIPSRRQRAANRAPTVLTESPYKNQLELSMASKRDVRRANAAGTKGSANGHQWQ